MVVKSKTTKRERLNLDVALIYFIRACSIEDYSKTRARLIRIQWITMLIRFQLCSHLNGAISRGPKHRIYFKDGTE